MPIKRLLLIVPLSQFFLTISERVISIQSFRLFDIDNLNLQMTDLFANDHLPRSFMISGLNYKVNIF